MLRSFEYAARSAISRAVERGQMATEERAHAVLDARIDLWATWASASFLRGYLDVTGATALLPARPDFVRLSLDANMLEKACYEVVYELQNRPDMAGIALGGIIELLGPATHPSEVP